MSDPRHLAEEKMAYLSRWLHDAKAIQAAVPKVQQQLELAEWEASTLSDAPRDALSPFSSELRMSLTEDLQTIKRALLPIPQ
jgi:hypothetical protein